MYLTLLAGIAFTLWLLALVCLLPSFLRAWGPNPHPADEWRCVALYCGGLFLGFNARRLFMAANQEPLSSLYAISIVLALYVLVLLFRKRRP